MKKLLLTVALGGLLATSCTTVSYTAGTADVSTSIHNRSVADLNVGKDRVSYTREWKWSPFNSVSDATEKENATAQLCAREGADVLVEPQYEVERRGLFRGGSVTVSGYPATFVNFRPMTMEDAQILATLNGVQPQAAGQVAPAAPTAPVAAVAPLRFEGPNTVSPKIGTSLLSGCFINAVGGGNLNGEFEEGAWNAGAMIGKNWNKWGVYLKGLYYKNEDDKAGNMFTVGAILNTSRKFGLFLGAGYGKSVYYNDSEDEDDATKTIAIDFGFQWRFARHFDMTFNLSTFGTSDHKNNVFATVGIGYCF